MFPIDKLHTSSEIAVAIIDPPWCLTLVSLCCLLSAFCSIQIQPGDVRVSIWSIGDGSPSGQSGFNGGGGMPPSAGEVGDRPPSAGSNGDCGVDMPPSASAGDVGDRRPGGGTCLHPRLMSGTRDLAEGTCLLRCPVLACPYLDHHHCIWSLALSFDLCTTSLGSNFLEI